MASNKATVIALSLGTMVIAGCTGGLGDKLTDRAVFPADRQDIRILRAEFIVSGLAAISATRITDQKRATSMLLAISNVIKTNNETCASMYGRRAGYKNDSKMEEVTKFEKEPVKSGDLTGDATACATVILDETTNNWVFNSDMYRFEQRVWDGLKLGLDDGTLRRLIDARTPSQVIRALLGILTDTKRIVRTARTAIALRRDALTIACGLQAIEKPVVPNIPNYLNKNTCADYLGAFTSKYKETSSKASPAYLKDILASMYDLRRRACRDLAVTAGLDSSKYEGKNPCFVEVTVPETKTTPPKPNTEQGKTQTQDG